MNRSRLLLVLWLGGALAGCQAALRPVFPAVTPAIVWPAPPDQPRVRYVGELRGEESLGARPRRWEVLRSLVAGPRPPVEFSRPTAVGVVGQRVFVADVGLGAVHLLDIEQRTHKLILGNPSDPLQVPIDVLALPDATIVVVDRGRAAIDFLDLDGQWLRTWSCADLRAPVSAAWDARRGLLWVADVADHTCYALQKGAIVRRLGGRGSAPGEFNFPSAVAWSAAVGLVVADAMNFRVQVFDDQDRPLAVFGRKGDAAGDFARPRDVAVDSEGHVYTLDNQFENVQVFDQSGRLLMALGRGGTEAGEFALPAGITIDSLDRIWVVDSYNRRVQVFQYLPEDE